MKERKIIGSLLLGLLCTVSSIAVRAAETNGLSSMVTAIANGSDIIMGEGAPIAHSNTKARFNSGGVDHTHQYIIASAIKLLYEDQGASCITNTNGAEKLLINTDWPDIYGNETDYATFCGHFYDPDTNKNWLGQTSPTAKTRAIDYYEKAVEAYRSGDEEGALTYLGRGTHYISDVNEPHHASNKTALNSNHTEFETYVDENRASYTIEGGSLETLYYTEGVTIELGTLIDQYAVESKRLYPLAADSKTYNLAAEQCVQNAIIANCQYLYKFCVEVGIY